MVINFQTFHVHLILVSDNEWLGASSWLDHALYLDNTEHFFMLLLFIYIILCQYHYIIAIYSYHILNFWNFA